MAQSLSRAVDRVKRAPLQLPGILDAALVERAFADGGHDWRDRTLGPGQTIELFLRQVTAGNASCGWVSHAGGGAFTPGAYCQARAGLPLEATWALCRLVSQQMLAEHSPRGDGPGDDGRRGEGDHVRRWRGLRPWYVDGTTFSMPDTPELQEAFGQPGCQKPGLGFPAAHLLVGFDAVTGMLLDAVPAPLRTHDLADVQHLHPHLSEGDVLVGDKAFGSWAHLALLLKSGVHGLFSLHQHRKVPAGERAFDRIEHWSKPPSKPPWLDQEPFDALPATMAVRVVRRRVPHSRGRGFRPLLVTLVTTLLDKTRYPADELVELGGGRWSAELNIRHLKTTLGLETLKCKTKDGVLKELAVFCLMYNLVRAVMLKAAARQQVAVERISFADALAWLRCTGVDAELWRLIVNPKRTRRAEPRALKRRPKPYPLLTRPREEERKRLENEARAD